MLSRVVAVGGLRLTQTWCQPSVFVAVKRGVQEAANAAKDAATAEAAVVVDIDSEFDREDPHAAEHIFDPPPEVANVDLDSEFDMRVEEKLTAEDFEPSEPEPPLDRPVELDTEMDMRPEETMTAEDFEPAVPVDPLDRPVDLDMEFDREIEDVEEDQAAA